METKNNLRVTLAQVDLAWENPQKNRLDLEILIGQLKGKSDLIILPETFTTGFSMHANDLAMELYVAPDTTCTEQHYHSLTQLQFASQVRLHKHDKRVLPQQVQWLKAERDQIEKALRREVGDDTPLTKLLDADSDWRGRAQQIALLKERLLSLHEAHAQVIAVFDARGVQALLHTWQSVVCESSSQQQQQQH